MLEMKRLPKSQFYAIDYKTGLIVVIKERDLKITYTVDRPKVDYYCTKENKMAINRHIEQVEVPRYHKLFKGGEEAKELEFGDIVRDLDDFIYRVSVDKTGNAYGKVIGDCVVFDNLDEYDEGDDDYDSEDD